MKEYEEEEDVTEVDGGMKFQFPQEVGCQFFE